MSHKRLKQKKKEQKKTAQKQRTLAKRRNIYAQIFEILEIKDKISSLPNSLKEDIYNFSWPKIAIDTKGIEDLPIRTQIEDAIKSSLDKETIEINGKFVFLSAVNYVIALREIIESWYKEFESVLRESEKNKNKNKNEKIIEKHNLRKTHDTLNYINSKLVPLVNSIYEKYLQAISNIACKYINAHFDFENGIYPKFVIGRTESQKTFPLIQVHKLNLKKEKLKIADQERTACLGHCVSLFGVSPISFEPNTIDNKEKIPVYIQDHAIIRLKERLGIIRPAGYLLDCLGRSLAKPVVVGFDGESYLIEYKLYDNYKLGYLIVSKTENFALVRSFKFITMTGTPEFKKLTGILRATKHDVSYLGLDTMDVFINSDISKDEKLKSIFEKSDLGHLLELCEIVTHGEDGIRFSSSSQQTIAKEIKEYFRV